MPKENTLLVVTGPTASGKTGWCVKLARHFNTEIVSADSRQFYRELNAGTAKPTREEQSLATHHFIDSLSVTDTYNAGLYEKDCIGLLDRLFSRHPVVILCGGSGLYIRAVLNGLDSLPPADPSLREELLAKSAEELRQQLRLLDPDYYDSADLRNTHRLMRAIEVSLLTGMPYSAHRGRRNAVRNFVPLITAIDVDRPVLYKRIDERVDEMLAAGLADEAARLREYRDLEPLRTIGYSEMFLYLDHKISFEETVARIRKNSRNYAKRQMTWLRSDKTIQWFKPHEYNMLVSLIESKIRR